MLPVALALAESAGAFAGDGSGNLNFIFGQKQMKQEDWEPVQAQNNLGMEMSWGEKNWPIMIATDLFGSYKEDKEEGITGKTSEFGLGIRKIWGHRLVHPYLGGGASLVYGGAELDFSGIIVTDTDTSPGAWADGGVFWRLGSRFNFGLAARYSKATVTLFDSDMEVGGYSGGLILGWGWPAPTAHRTHAPPPAASQTPVSRAYDTR
jgi:hypothetical protein